MLLSSYDAHNGLDVCPADVANMSFVPSGGDQPGMRDFCLLRAVVLLLQA